MLIRHMCNTEILFFDSKNWGVLGSQMIKHKKMMCRTPNTNGTCWSASVAPATYPLTMPMLKLINIAELSRPLILETIEFVKYIMYSLRCASFTYWSLAISPINIGMHKKIPPPHKPAEHRAKYKCHGSVATYNRIQDILTKNELPNSRTCNYILSPTYESRNRTHHQRMFASNEFDKISVDYRTTNSRQW